VTNDDSFTVYRGSWSGSVTLRPLVAQAFANHLPLFSDSLTLDTTLAGDSLRLLPGAGNQTFRDTVNCWNNTLFWHAVEDGREARYTVQFDSLMNGILQFTTSAAGMPLNQGSALFTLNGIGRGYIQELEPSLSLVSTINLNLSGTSKVNGLPLIP
jgi:hypothetical protein